MREPGFIAKVASDCRRCGRPVVPGERVVWTTGRHGVIHIGCASGADDE